MVRKLYTREGFVSSTKCEASTSVVHSLKTASLFFEDVGLAASLAPRKASGRIQDHVCKYSCTNLDVVVSVL